MDTRPVPVRDQAIKGWFAPRDETAGGDDDFSRSQNLVVYGVPDERCVNILVVPLFANLCRRTVEDRTSSGPMRNWLSAKSK